MKWLLVCTLLGVVVLEEFSLPQFVQGKVFTKCGLTVELIRRNFNRSLIGNWVCLIESESGKDTSKITNKANGSKNLGLFQINSKEWCMFGRNGGLCNMKCEDLLNENLVDDSDCAKKVERLRGFQEWPGWVRNCRGKSASLPIPSC